MDHDAVRAVLAALEREGVRYAVFGGVALNLHGIARMTEDLDLYDMKKDTVRARDRADAEALKKRFGLGDDR